MLNRPGIQRTRVVNSSIGDNGPLMTDVVEHSGDDHSDFDHHANHHLEESLDDLAWESAWGSCVRTRSGPAVEATCLAL